MTLRRLCSSDTRKEQEWEGVAKCVCVCGGGGQGSYRVYSYILFKRSLATSTYSDAYPL